MLFTSSHNQLYFLKITERQKDFPLRWDAGGVIFYKVSSQYPMYFIKITPLASYQGPTASFFVTMNKILDSKYILYQYYNQVWID